ncbi:TetR/AcrR family transcriptional regulator [Streptomyces sp. 110]|uniref:TetR/AcrR family transcriptional regulator n=1 Tax=Streptomyces endocoffeicus TaxID=2898945 RepID=A0ABS1Q586_9ACTN|nr:TetR/AcrR family transcriptional regulator [Streptomyces endocoffeicus]MBL1119822.1 TetR/AcrR family transcriptional regulator [Streptomyces endocoffeicus]
MEKTSTAGPAAPKPARTRNRRGEGGRLREDIVSAAAALLDETGDEHAITLRSVARKVGISAPSIYPHFPDQPAIMLAVVQREFAELETLLRSVAQEAGDDPREQLYAVCRSYLAFAQRHPERYRTMFGGLWMPSLGDNSLTEEDLVSLGSTAIQVLVDVLTDCAAAGRCAISDPSLDAVTLWLSLHGLAHQRAVIRAFPWSEESIADSIIARIARLKDA